ncbi:methyltransferase domain-containing protein [bacterium]|nr:methyltransferase domain-containing protein [bacterium]
MPLIGCGPLPIRHTRTIRLWRWKKRLCWRICPQWRISTSSDLACGTGRYTQHLIEREAHVLSLDHSIHMLAHGTAPRAAQADLTALPLAAASVGGMCARWLSGM